ncbi:MAG: iron-containing alcohol dehydrogenase [Saprospiraceae bacterium]
MIETFNFGRVPDIYFGVGKFSLIPNLIKEFGQRVLVITGKSSFVDSKNWDTLRELFELHHLEWTQTTVEQEPTPEIIDEIVYTYENANIEAVLAIGGGSVIDAGKAVAAMLPIGNYISDYLEEFGSEIHSGHSLPFVAVPTTAGTGSETTRFAMISEVGKRGEKKRLIHSNFTPTISVIDPHLMYELPPKWTAIGGLNILSQLIESYLSMGANELTDTLAFKGITYVCQKMERTYKAPHYASGRTNMAYAAMVSGVTGTNSGLGLTNGLANSIAGKYDIPFSMVTASLSAEVCKMTILEVKKYYSEGLALAKYARIGRLLHKSRGKSDAYYRDMLVNKLAEWTTLFEIPTLSELGITSDDFSDIIQYANNQNNAMPVMDEEISQILNSRL